VSIYFRFANRSAYRKRLRTSAVLCDSAVYMVCGSFTAETQRYAEHAGKLRHNVLLAVSKLNETRAALHFFQGFGNEGSDLVSFFAAVGVGLVEVEIGK